MKHNLKTEHLYHELEEVAGRLFQEIRREEGWFRTGVCKIRGKTVLFLNGRQTIDERIAALAGALARCNVEGVYLKPVVRAEIERHAQEGARRHPR